MSRGQIRAPLTFLASSYISSLFPVTVLVFLLTARQSSSRSTPHRTPILSLVNNDGLRRLWLRQATISMSPLHLHLDDGHHHIVAIFQASRVPLNSNASISRKVTASLDLFKENAPSPSKEKVEVEAFDLPRPDCSTGKRRAVAPLTEVSERQFEYVRRSDWPDRGAAAIQREESWIGLDRIRTCESRNFVTSSRDQDFRRHKERTLSRRETVLSDLVHWRAAVDAGREHRDGC